MAVITLGNNPVNTIGELPEAGLKAPDFKLVNKDLDERNLSDFSGSNLVLNIFPSLDTRICAASVRQFNELASSFENTLVLCISKDLPFAFNRFCTTEGLENVITLSDFKTGQFGKDYHLEIQDGPFAGLHSRVVIILDGEGIVRYTEQVPEIGQEPDYEAVIRTLRTI